MHFRSDALSAYLQVSPDIRSWFAREILFKPIFIKTVFDYLVYCPIPDVQKAFRKLLVILTVYLRIDGPCPPPVGVKPLPPSATMADYIIRSLLLSVPLIPAQGEGLSSYCRFFFSYSEQGAY